MRLHNTELTALCALLILTGESAQTTSVPDVRVELDPTTIVLGEPVWVDVKITNRSPVPLTIDVGNTCFGARPLIVRVPGAEPGNGKHECVYGAMGGSCGVSLPPVVQPGKTLTERYVFEGDFHIAHAGVYNVDLEKPIRYGPPSGTPESPRSPKQEETVHVQTTLHVLPANPDKLLAIEQSQAAEVTATMSPPPLPSGADIEAIRRADEIQRAAEYDGYLRREAIAAGLWTYPAPGMEPIFRAWLAPNNTSYADYAVIALSHLNTPASRQILAEQAASAAKPRDSFYQIHRWEAIDALAEMGDTSYLPLMERLLNDPYHDVQRAAVRALALLGGEKELPLLNTRVRTSTNQVDRIDAIQAMGESASLQAVPMLIDLFTLPDADEPGESDYALSMLTHEHLPATPKLRTALESKSLWQAWWVQNERTARAYSPYECDPALHYVEASPFQ